MGKQEDGHGLQGTAADAQGTTSVSGNSSGCCCCLSCIRVRKAVSFRCVFVLVLGIGVLLSAVFWLPIFHFGDHRDLDLDYAGRDIVATFMLNKPTSFLQDHILQLEDDIFDEMSFSTTKVQVIRLKPVGLNITKVVFAVESDWTTRSLIKASFVSLITHQSFLHLTESLFGDPFSFDVLKFKGGITASPEQKAYLLQSVQILFNFTLNFNIDQMLYNFNELRSQLKTGLHLAPYENLYIGLTNLRGSTVDPPTTVQVRVLLAVGINTTKSRLKQLAQTITGSHSKNLGLNNTVFGKVKQVSLSSILQHSLGGDAGGPSPSPSPSPLLQPHHHHHQHHHHHRRHHDASPAPSLSPSPSPSPSPSRGTHGSVIGKRSHSHAHTPAPALAPGKSKPAKPPGCHFHKNRFPKYHSAPSVSPVHVPSVAPSQPKQINSPTPVPLPVPSAASPKPNVAHAHSPRPLRGGSHASPVEVLPIVSPSPSPSSAHVFSSNIWALLPVLFVVLHL